MAKSVFKIKTTSLCKWEKELVERAREIRAKKSGVLTFEVKLVAAKRIKMTISGGPASWYEEEENGEEKNGL